MRTPTGRLRPWPPTRRSRKQPALRETQDGSTLIVFGLVLGLADRVAANRRPLEALTTRQALALGTAQALSLIPGVSRSGGTISAGLLLGYTRPAAARYAFLLAVPAVLASGGLELTKLGEGPGPQWGPTALATVVAFGTGYLVIAWFLRYISTHRFTPFVWYRVGLSVLCNYIHRPF